MSSVKKNNRRTKEDPIFKFDPETGKCVPLPRKWLCPSVTNSGEDILSEKKVKRMPLLAPLRWTPADFEESPNRASKLRKTDNNSVRKELFSFPAKGSKISRPTMYNRQSSTRRSIATKRVQPKVFKPGQLSPLLDMEEVEEQLLQKKGCLQGYPFKTPSKPIIKFTKPTPPTKATSLKDKFGKKDSLKMECPVTPNSGSSTETEFLEIEKMCYVNESDNENCNQSPISSVCNLLESAGIHSIKKQKKVVNTGNIQDIVHNLQILHQEHSVAFKQYKTKHEENMAHIKQILETDRSNYENLLAQEQEINSKITGFLNSLENVSTTKTDDKENSSYNRRSIRLLNKSPLQSKNANLIVSPVIVRGGDLRKSTLTKNLVTKSQQYEIQSPRIQKALDMYNSMRNDMNILATPKLDRRPLYESPKSTNLARSLSRRVQSQCLLLQGTPVHK